MGAVGVHQSDTLNARNIVSVFLVEQVEVFVAQTDAQRLCISRSDVDVGQHGDGAGP